MKTASNQHVYVPSNTLPPDVVPSGCVVLNGLNRCTQTDTLRAATALLGATEKLVVVLVDVVHLRRNPAARKLVQQLLNTPGDEVRVVLWESRFPLFFGLFLPAAVSALVDQCGETAWATFSVNVPPGTSSPMFEWRI